MINGDFVIKVDENEYTAVLNINSLNAFLDEIGADDYGVISELVAPEDGIYKKSQVEKICWLFYYAIKEGIRKSKQDTAMPDREDVMEVVLEPDTLNAFGQAMLKSLPSEPSENGEKKNQVSLQETS